VAPSSPRLTLLGGDHPLAEALLRLLEESSLEVGEVDLVSLDPSDATVSFRGEELDLRLAADIDWKQAGIVVVTSWSPAADAWRERAEAAGCPVIGAGSRSDPIRPGSVVAAERCLGLVHRALGARSAHLACNLPVSEKGRAGIDELSAQTRALFALETPEPEVFLPRIAFNLVPEAGESAAEPRSRFERSVEAGLHATLPGVGCMVSATWMPVFYGYSATLHAVCERAVDGAEFRALFRDHPGITLMDEPVAGGQPTPATDAQDSDAVFVGRLRSEGGDAGRVQVWMVYDGLRLEALQLQAALENLIENPAKSVLT